MNIPTESVLAARRRGFAAQGGTAVSWPRDVELMYGISAVTRWRWEKAGKLPPRDVNMAGKTGWKPETLAANERGPAS